MTDLTGAELALAVAQVMQRGDVQWCDDLVNVCQSIRNRDTGKHAAWVPWRPDQGGAAAWEVLEWVRGREFRLELSTRPNGDCVAYLYRDVEDDASGCGLTDAIALCRAVVSLGEAG